MFLMSKFVLYLSCLPLPPQLRRGSECNLVPLRNHWSDVHFHAGGCAGLGPCGGSGGAQGRAVPLAGAVGAG